MIEINYDAIVQNALYFKRLLKDAKLCAVLKNDAYGHSLYRVASLLRDIVDYFAVANCEEAACLDELGKPTLILMPVNAQDLRNAIDLKNVVFTLDSFDTLKTISNSNFLRKNIKVHVKIDSGMSRLGFRTEELPNLLSQLPNNVIIEGVYSHFWGDTKRSCDKQTSRFLRGATFLEKALNKKLVKHIANTSGTLLSSQYHLDMARIGIGLYGYGGAVKVAKTVSAHVIALRSVCRGDVVGYGGVKVKNSTRIAVLNCGYANGLPRSVTGAKVLVSGQLRPIVGYVCMGMCLVDVGSLPVQVGDDVILLGEGVNISNKSLIIYELLCNLK